MEIGNIINGHVNELLGLKDDISKKRMAICHRCPLYKNILGGICNPKLWLDPKTGRVSTVSKDNYYKGCGCRLQAKTRVSGAFCPALKW